MSERQICITKTIARETKPTRFLYSAHERASILFSSRGALWHSTPAKSKTTAAHRGPDGTNPYQFAESNAQTFHNGKSSGTGTTPFTDGAALRACRMTFRMSRSLVSSMLMNLATRWSRRTGNGSLGWLISSYTEAPLISIQSAICKIYSRQSKLEDAAWEKL